MACRTGRTSPRLGGVRPLPGYRLTLYCTLPSGASDSQPGRSALNPVQCAQLNSGRCSVSTTLSSRSVPDASLEFPPRC